MSDVLHRTTAELRRSVHTPDFDPGEWIINPRDPDTCAAVPQRYRVIIGDNWREMDQGEKDQVDAQLAAGARADQKEAAKQEIDTLDAIAAVAELTRKQLNVLRTRAGLAEITRAQMRDAIFAEIDARS